MGDKRALNDDHLGEIPPDGGENKNFIAGKISFGGEHENEVLGCACETFAIKWRASAALKALDAGTLDSVREMLDAILREIHSAENVLAPVPVRRDLAEALRQTVGKEEITESATKVDGLIDEKSLERKAKADKLRSLAPPGEAGDAIRRRLQELAL